MDESGARAILQFHLDASAAGDVAEAHTIYHPDAVLEFPQSGERFEGVDNIRGFREVYPAEVHLSVRRFRGGGDVWIAEVAVSYDDGPENYGLSIQEFRGDKVAAETIYYAEAFEAPDWRARWRVAPARPAGVD